MWTDSAAMRTSRVGALPLHDLGLPAMSGASTSLRPASSCELACSSGAARTGALAGATAAARVGAGCTTPTPPVSTATRKQMPARHHRWWRAGGELLGDVDRALHVGMELTDI